MAFHQHVTVTRDVDNAKMDMLVQYVINVKKDFLLLKGMISLGK